MEFAPRRNQWGSAEETEKMWTSRVVLQCSAILEIQVCSCINSIIDFGMTRICYKPGYSLTILLTGANWKGTVYKDLSNELILHCVHPAVPRTIVPIARDVCSTLEWVIPLSKTVKFSMSREAWAGTADATSSSHPQWRNVSGALGQKEPEMLNLRMGIWVVLKVARQTTATQRYSFGVCSAAHMRFKGNT